MDEDDERVRGYLSKAGSHGVAPRLTSRYARVDLAASLLLREEDRRLLPAGRRHQDDPVHPRTALEPPQRLGEQWLVAELRERLGSVQAEPFPPPRSDEDDPDGHVRRPD